MAEEGDNGVCLCGAEYDDGRDMICCDECDVWYHYECVSITDDDVELMGKDDKYSCPICISKKCDNGNKLENKEKLKAESTEKSLENEIKDNNGNKENKDINSENVSSDTSMNDNIKDVKDVKDVKVDKKSDNMVKDDKNEQDFDIKMDAPKANKNADSMDKDLKKEKEKEEKSDGASKKSRKMGLPPRSVRENKNEKQKVERYDANGELIDFGIKANMEAFLKSKYALDTGIDENEIKDENVYSVNENGVAFAKYGTEKEIMFGCDIEIEKEIVGDIDQTIYIDQIRYDEITIAELNRIEIKNLENARNHCHKQMLEMECRVLKDIYYQEHGSDYTSSDSDDDCDSDNENDNETDNDNDNEMGNEKEKEMENEMKNEMENGQNVNNDDDNNNNDNENDENDNKIDFESMNDYLDNKRFDGRVNQVSKYWLDRIKWNDTYWISKSRKEKKEEAALNGLSESNESNEYNMEKEKEKEREYMLEREKREGAGEFVVPLYSVPVRADVGKFDFGNFSRFVQSYTVDKRLFDVIMMDPPWQLSNENPTRGVAIGYCQLTDPLISNLPMHLLQHNGFLCVWVINAKYQMTLDLMNKWGYQIVNDLAWVKSTIHRRVSNGHGYYLQHAKESCVIGFKGDANMMSRLMNDHGTVSDLIYCERKGQSQKPRQIYEYIERLVPNGYYLEIFGRRNNLRSGWVTIGNEL